MHNNAIQHKVVDIPTKFGIGSIFKSTAQVFNHLQLTEVAFDTQGSISGDVLEKNGTGIKIKKSGNYIMLIKLYGDADVSQEGSLRISLYINGNYVDRFYYSHNGGQITCKITDIIYLTSGQKLTLGIVPVFSGNINVTLNNCSLLLYRISK